MNSTILNQMSQMKFYGMQQAYQAVLDSNQHHSLTNDEMISMLVQADRIAEAMGRPREP